MRLDATHKENIPVISNKPITHLSEGGEKDVIATFSDGIIVIADLLIRSNSICLAVRQLYINLTTILEYLGISNISIILLHIKGS